MKTIKGVSGLMAYSSYSHDVYVSNETANSIDIVNGEKNTFIGSIQDIPASDMHEQMVYDPVHALLFVLIDINTTTVINTKTNSVSKILTVAYDEDGIVYGNGFVYIGNVQAINRYEVNSSIAIICT